MISKEAKDALKILNKWSNENHIYDFWKIEEMELYPKFTDDTEDIVDTWLVELGNNAIENAINLDFKNRDDKFFIFSETDIATYALWFYPELSGEPPVLKFSDGGHIKVVASSMAEFVCRLGRNLADEYLDDLEEEYDFENQEKALEAIFADYDEFRKRVNKKIDCSLYTDHKKMMQRHNPILVPMLEYNKVEVNLDGNEIISCLNMPLYSDRVLSLLDKIGYELPLFPFEEENYSTPVREGVSFYFRHSDKEDKKLILETIDFSYECEFLPFGIKDTDSYKVVSKKLENFGCYFDPEDNEVRYWFSQNKKFFIKVWFTSTVLDEVYAFRVNRYELPSYFNLEKEENK